jgi:hypothetical protein
MWAEAAERHQLSRLDITRFSLREGDNQWRRPTIPLVQVRRRLNGVGDAVIQQMIEMAEMPKPVSFNPEPVWNTAEFYCWHWSRKTKFELAAAANRAETGAITKGVYRTALVDRINEEAAKHGCELSHTITIGFTRDVDGNWSHRSVKAQNEAIRGDVERIGKALGRACWRLWNRQCGVPDDLFLYFITPERLDRHGNEVPWHFHIDLFLRPVEARLLNRWWPTIENRIYRMVSKLPGTPSIRLEPVTQGFTGYSQKNIHDTVDMTSSNFMHGCHK